MSENENKNTEQQEKPAAGKKGFGNTIILFIVFFIIFTVLVTGVAFFANKIRNSGSSQTTQPQAKDVTNPSAGNNFVMDDKGNVDKNAQKPAQQSAPAQPQAQQSAQPQPTPVQPAPASPEQKVAPAAPPVAKPEPMKQAPAAKPAAKETKPAPAPAKPATVAAQPAPAPAPAKPVPAKTEPVKAAPAKTAPAKAEPVKAAAVVKKAEPVKTVKKAEPVKQQAAVKQTAQPKQTTAAKPAAATAAKPAAQTAAPKAQTKNEAISSANDQPGEYYVQLASFKSLDLAESEYHSMSSKVNDLQLVKVDLGDKGVWYRLRCGKPLSYSAAKAKAAEISSKTNYVPDIMKK